jgi:hypothetical protein
LLVVSGNVSDQVARPPAPTVLLTCLVARIALWVGEK